MDKRLIDANTLHAKIMKDNYFNETTYKGNMSEWLNLGQSYLKKPKNL